MKSLTKRLAYGLVHRAKIRPDDVILAFSENTLLYPAFVQAALASSLCVTVIVSASLRVAYMDLPDFSASESSLSG